MKRILIIVEDAEHKQLVKLKKEKNTTWHDLLMSVLKR